MGMADAIDKIHDAMMITYMNEWQHACWEIAEEKGFHKPDRLIEGVERDASPVERMMLIVSEVSEMLEAYRSNRKPGGYYHEVDGKPEGVASELADVMIRCLDYAEIYGVPLGAVMVAKLMYNTTRPYQHGGKNV